MKKFSTQLQGNPHLPPTKSNQQPLSACETSRYNIMCVEVLLQVIETFERAHMYRECVEANMELEKRIETLSLSNPTWKSYLQPHYARVSGWYLQLGEHEMAEEYIRRAELTTIWTGMSMLAILC